MDEKVEPQIQEAQHSPRTGTRDTARSGPRLPSLTTGDRGTRREVARGRVVHRATRRVTATSRQKLGAEHSAGTASERSEKADRPFQYRLQTPAQRRQMETLSDVKAEEPIAGGPDGQRAGTLHGRRGPRQHTRKRWLCQEKRDAGPGRCTGRHAQRRHTAGVGGTGTRPRKVLLLHAKCQHHPRGG